LVGPEAASATPVLLAIANRLGAALLTTPDAKGLVPPPRCSGTFSFGASPLAKKAMADADVVLALSALGEFSCRLGEGFRHKAVIQVTERCQDVGRSFEPHASLTGPIHNTLKRLQRALVRAVPEGRPVWFTQQPISTLAPPLRPGRIHPITAIAAIEAALPEEARICLDVTSGAVFAYEHLNVSARQRVFSSIENSACMGEALMASAGIRIASGLPTLCVVGDWGYCMTPAELHAAVEQKLDRYVVLVWSNSGGAFIGAGVRQQGIRVPDKAWHWRVPPNFARLAKAYGARGVRVTDGRRLQVELARALRGPGPVVIEAIMDPDVPVPAGERFLTLGEARG
jgi:thiamine pyrophosphate-dependent acetolactate synthase large subunit-like protein